MYRAGQDILSRAWHETGLFLRWGLSDPDLSKVSPTGKQSSHREECSRQFGDGVLWLGMNLAAFLPRSHLARRIYHTYPGLLFHFTSGSIAQRECVPSVPFITLYN